MRLRTNVATAALYVVIPHSGRTVFSRRVGIAYHDTGFREPRSSLLRRGAVRMMSAEAVAQCGMVSC